jgi:hypothetical protein
MQKILKYSAPRMFARIDTAGHVPSDEMKAAALAEFWLSIEHLPWEETAEPVPEPVDGTPTPFRANPIVAAPIDEQIPHHAHRLEVECGIVPKIGDAHKPAPLRKGRGHLKREQLAARAAFRARTSAHVLGRGTRPHEKIRADFHPVRESTHRGHNNPEREQNQGSHHFEFHRPGYEHIVAVLTMARLPAGAREPSMRPAS